MESPGNCSISDFKMISPKGWSPVCAKNRVIRLVGLIALTSTTAAKLHEYKYEYLISLVVDSELLVF